MRLRGETGPIASARRLKAIAVLRRRLPYITATNALPLLRRPGRRQSLAVAMVLKKKIKKRQRRQNLADLLDDSVGTAREEDSWDARLYEMGLARAQEERYEAEAVAAARIVKTRMRDVDKQALALTVRFKEIIEKERAAKERAIGEYKRVKRKRARTRAARKKRVMREYPQYFPAVQSLT